MTKHIIALAIAALDSSAYEESPPIHLTINRMGAVDMPAFNHNESFGGKKSKKNKKGKSLKDWE